MKGQLVHSLDGLLGQNPGSMVPTPKKNNADFFPGPAGTAFRNFKVDPGRFFASATIELFLFVRFFFIFRPASVTGREFQNFSCLFLYLHQNNFFFVFFWFESRHTNSAPITSGTHTGGVQ